MTPTRSPGPPRKRVPTPTEHLCPDERHGSSPGSSFWSWQRPSSSRGQCSWPCSVPEAICAQAPIQVTSPGRALVSSVAKIENSGDARDFLGNTRLQIEATARSAGHGVFVGVAPAAAVDRYLAGADVDVVQDFDLAPFTLTTDRRAGTAAPAAPAAQDFWVARAEATTGAAALTWTVQRRGLPRRRHERRRDPRDRRRRHLRRRDPAGVRAEHGRPGDRPGARGAGHRPAPRGAAAAPPPRSAGPARAGTHRSRTLPGPVPTQSAPPIAQAAAAAGPPATGREQEPDAASPRT